MNNYVYDAENNLIAIGGGSNASYQYDALNGRVATTSGSQTQFFGNDLQGRRSTTWQNGSTSIASVQYYAGSQRVAYWSNTDNNIHYEHQDWLGTERVRTTANASLEGTFSSLPFGDNVTPTGSDNNLSHFAQTDEDVSATSNLDHAIYREYGAGGGRWMSSDPYIGSYDLTNPQSLNRYTYALNNPLSLFDPSGLIACDYGGGDYDDADDANECTSNGGVLVGTTDSVTVYGSAPGPVNTVGPPSGAGGGGTGSGSNAAPPPAPSNGTPTTPRTPQQCAGAALKKNAVALTLDAAGIGAGFLPGGELVVAGAQATVSVASGVNSAVGGDGVGSALGVLGLPAAYAGTAAKFVGVGVKAIPGIGTAISALGALNDVYGSYNDYQACLAGH